MEEFVDLKVLIVDDEQPVIDSTKKMLATEDIYAYGITNPVEAIEHLKENKVDLILLDWRMTPITGDVFIEKLREFDRKTMIVVRTGMSNQLPPLDTIKRYNIQRIYRKGRKTRRYTSKNNISIKISKISQRNRNPEL